MKNYLIASVLISLMWASSFVSAQETTKPEWKDITNKLKINRIEDGGWKDDAKGKIYRDKEGNHLKISSGEFGDFWVDLTNQKVYRLEGETKKEEMPVSQMIQRDFGLSLVFKTDKLKAFCKLTEKVEGMKGIPGIKASEPGQ